MSNQPILPTLLRAGACAAALWALAGAPAAADDRALLNASNAEPYVFILFDTSGSMNWTPFCSTADFNNGVCSSECPSGDCFAWGSSDDQNSKLFQAKKVLYETIESANQVNFGFATYNQNQLGVTDKHWTYKARNRGLQLPYGNYYPEPDPALNHGDEWWEIFGEEWNCRSGSTVGCPRRPNTFDTITPADTNDDWDLQRARRLSKLDSNLGSSTQVIIRTPNNKSYEVTYSHASGYPSEQLGSPTIHVQIDIYSLNLSNNTHTSEYSDSIVVPYDLVYLDFDGDGTGDAPAEVVLWDNGARRGPSQEGYYSTDDVRSTDTCAGWDPNNPISYYNPYGLDANDDDDPYRNTNLRFPNGLPDPRDGGITDLFLVGDVIPFDWLNSHRQDILNRLAPNRVTQSGNTNFLPDFGIGRYLTDTQSNSVHTLKNSSERPLIADGSTPIGDSVQNFEAWYGQWRDRANGTVAIPGGADDSYGCRSKFLLVLTDGDETCSNNPCNDTQDLFDDYNVQTFVVAYGLQNSTTLNCMPWFFPLQVADTDSRCQAVYSGDGKCYDCPASDLQSATHPITGETVPVCRQPFFAASADELKEALSKIIQLVSTDSRSFSSAAVPSVQAEEADKIYLSSFVPIKGESVWPGRIDAYLRPLPLKEVFAANGEVSLVPDPSKDCDATSPAQESSCHLWEANDSENFDAMLAQIPSVARSAVQLPTVANIESALAPLLDYTDGGYSDLDFETWLGDATDKRRVLYAREDGAANTVPAEQRLFLPPNSSLTGADAIWRDLIRTFSICTSPVDSAACFDGSTSAGQAARDEVRRVMRFHILPKVAEDPQDASKALPYMMGDIFHSDPVVISSPSNFSFFVEDLGADVNGNGGYRDFVLKHRTRRRMLAVGSNDGQVHLLDAGVYNAGLDDAGNLSGDYGNGTGKEIVSFMPKGVKPTVRLLATGTDQRFTVDGTVRVDDVFIDPSHSGTPTASERQWRTVMLGGLREGGRAYYALDITQPDEIQFKVVDGVTTKFGESVIDSNGDELATCYDNNNPDCGPVPFPAVLWQFTDLLDEDGVGGADLGDTWSRPNTGRVLICEGTGNCDDATDTNNVFVDKYVAVFGGGMDSTRLNQRGDWIYMVDIETGKIIWKYPTIGSVPSEPAAVDRDNDGYLDTIYIGTTAGYMYKADISKAVRIESTTVYDAATTSMVSVDRVTDSSWNAFAVFSTGGKPIYYPPAVVFIPETGQYSLAFGVGDRENLWTTTTQPGEGRFYQIVDNNFQIGMTPRTEADYPSFDSASSAAADANLLTTGARGWVLQLDSGRIEQLVTPPFALSGITLFSTFLPGQAIGEDGSVCAQVGSSRLYVVFTTNGNGVSRDSNGDSVRFREVSDLVTSPFVQEGTTKNRFDPDNPGNSASPCSGDEQVEIREILKQQLPDNCTFGNFTQDILTRRSREGIECVAPVPVCMIQHNWRDL